MKKNLLERILLYTSPESLFAIRKGHSPGKPLLHFEWHSEVRALLMQGTAA
jgi:hypothetical protein